MKLSNSATNLWFGSEDSYLTVLSAIKELHALEAKGLDALKAAVVARGGGGGDDPFGLPPLLKVHGNVGVVAVDGPMIAGHAGFLRLFGVTGYDDIKGAVADALGNTDVKSILLSIDSGGGQVSGVESAGEFIQQADKIKPVVAHTDGTMASAAYWLGASAREVFGSKTAHVGSVGTLVMHMERSKQLAADGITPTIIRHGKFKALANPVEPLSAEGKAELQNLVDASGQVFVEYVAKRRGVSASEFQKTAGEGRVFAGVQAKDVGLIDGVKSFDQTMAHMKSLDTRSSSTQNSRNPQRGTQMKVAFSKKTVLALAAGAALDSLGLDAPEANAEGVKLEADAVAALQTEATEVKAAFDARVTAAVTEATAPLTAQVTAATEAKAKAEADLAAANSQLAVANTATAALQGKLDESAKLAASSAEIIKASMSVMSVALGGSPDVGASLVGSELLAEHDRLKDSFIKKFPAGGVAAVHVAAKQPEAQSSGIPAHFRHLVNANAAK